MSLESDVEKVLKDVEKVPKIAEDVAILGEKAVVDVFQYAASASKKFSRYLGNDLGDDFEAILQPTPQVVQSLAAALITPKHGPESAVYNATRVGRSSLKAIKAFVTNDIIHLEGNSKVVTDIKEIGAILQGFTGAISTLVPVDLSKEFDFFNDMMRALDNNEFDSNVIGSLARPVDSILAKMQDFEKRFSEYIVKLATAVKQALQNLPSEVRKSLPIRFHVESQGVASSGADGVISNKTYQELRIGASILSIAIDAIKSLIDRVTECFPLDLGTGIGGGAAAGVYAAVNAKIKLLKTSPAIFLPITVGLDVLSSFIPNGMTIIDAAMALSE
ncbi:MAG: hypothetical protein KTR24_16140 [Saprospiraceae bacterium]|nr:hypothetical protein [Saprospiraceae bacterium]